jgi:putative ABC transport system permease protein
MSLRVFRALLALYPERFRREYGTDAEELFRDRLEEARRRGRGHVARLWASTVPNLVWHGLLERAVTLRASVRLGVIGGAFGSAARKVLRSPGVSSAIVLTLGLGIGANVALYSVLRTVLIRPLPYPEAERLVQLWETNPAVDDELHGPSPWNFTDWEATADGFTSMAAWYLTSGTYRTDRWVEEVRSAQVTPDFFRTLGVEPLLGRAFSPDDVERYGPVMLSHGIWTRLFGGDPTVVGRTIVSSGNSYTIVGVMPHDFAFPDPSVETWVAWNLPNVYADQPEARTWRFLQAVGRLEGQTSVSEAEEALDRVAASLAETWPEMSHGWGASVTSLHEDIVGDTRATLWISFASVLFILLIACANVANLLLARVPLRSAEVGLRAALGASRSRIALDVLVEHTLLGVLSGAIGLLVGAGLLELLVALDAGGIPRLSEVAIDRGVLAFTLSAALLTTLLFGGAPLLQLVRATRVAPSSLGRRATGSAGRRSLRHVFVGGQLAVALVLLAGAGLFLSSLQRIVRVDPGFEPTNVATFRVSLDPVEGAAGETVGYYEGLEERLRALPGVLSVGSAQSLPMNPVSNDFRRPYRRAGSGLGSADAPTVQMRIVTPGDPEAIGMRLLEGAQLPSDASVGEPLVALLNRTLAARLYPDGGAVGSTFEIDFREGWQPYRVVGVVEDVRHYGPRREPLPEVFLSHRQVPYLAMSTAVRTESDPAAMFGSLRDAVRIHRPMQPAHAFVTMEDLLRDSMAAERFLSVLLGLFAGIGLFLASTGVYGVIASSVSHRRREIGVRMALGADGAQVVTAVLAEALGMAVAGLVVGGIGVLGLGRLVEGLLFGVSPTDPTNAVAVVATLASVAALAAWLPARRAAYVAPSEALRSD